MAWVVAKFEFAWAAWMSQNASFRQLSVAKRKKISKMNRSGNTPSHHTILRADTQRQSHTSISQRIPTGATQISGAASSQALERFMRGRHCRSECKLSSRAKKHKTRKCHWDYWWSRRTIQANERRLHVRWAKEGTPNVRRGSDSRSGMERCREPGGVL